MPNSRGVHLALLTLALGAWTVVIIQALAAFAPTLDWLTAIAGFLGTCPQHAASGQPCPLCGTTSAARLLIGGDVATSLALNPLALGLVALGLTQPLYRFTRVVRPRFSWTEEACITGPGIVWLLVVIISVS